MKDWSKYVGKKLPFFETEIYGRTVRVSASLRPMEEGNIMWQLATKTRVGNHWSTPWIYLEDMRKLGFLFLALSKFCKKTRYMSEETLNEIMTFKKKWKRLVDTDFRGLETRKTFLRELWKERGIS